MLSALVSLPRGAPRTLLLKELRRLGVGVFELTADDENSSRLRRPSLDLVVVGSDAAHASPLKPLLGQKRSRPPVIMVQTSTSLHESPAYDDDMFCLHRPVKPCLIRAYIQAIAERKKAYDRLAEFASSGEMEEHSVDDLWFAIFQRLKGHSRK